MIPCSLVERYWYFGEKKAASSLNRRISYLEEVSVTHSKRSKGHASVNEMLGDKGTRRRLGGRDCQLKSGNKFLFLIISLPRSFWPYPFWSHSVILAYSESGVLSSSPNTVPWFSMFMALLPWKQKQHISSKQCFPTSVPWRNL